MQTNKSILIGYSIIGFSVLLTIFLFERDTSIKWINEMGVWVIFNEIFVLSFVLWPYLVIGRILKKYSWWSPQKLVLECVVIFLVSAVGIYLLVDILLFPDGDANSVLAVILVPFIQIAVYGFLISFFFVTFKK